MKIISSIVSMSVSGLIMALSNGAIAMEPQKKQPPKKQQEVKAPVLGEQRKFTIRADKDDAPVEFDVQWLKEGKAELYPFQGTSKGGVKVFFFTKDKHHGTHLDTNADIKVPLEDGCEATNAELALFFAQLKATGSHPGDLELFRKMVGLKMGPDQAYAIKQGQAYLTFEQFKNVFGIDKDAEISQQKIEELNLDLEKTQASVRIMTEANWNGRDPSFKFADKKNIETYTYFPSKNTWVHGYRFWDPSQEKNGACLRRKAPVTYWKCDVEKWDCIKGDAMEYVLMRRATIPGWLSTAQAAFPAGSTLVHLSGFDSFFAVQFSANAKGLEKDQGMGKNVQGEILTKLLAMDIEAIKARAAVLEAELFAAPSLK